jgi:serine/threonine-protein kinase HipA
MLAGLQPKLLLARFGGNWYLPHGRAHSTHILKPRLPGRPDGLAREQYDHALAAQLGLAHYHTELAGNGARQYLVIERYDRAVDGEMVTLIGRRCRPHGGRPGQGVAGWLRPSRRSSTRPQHPRPP